MPWQPLALRETASWLAKQRPPLSRPCPAPRMAPGPWSSAGNFSKLLTNPAHVSPSPARSRWSFSRTLSRLPPPRCFYPLREPATTLSSPAPVSSKRHCLITYFERQCNSVHPHQPCHTQYTQQTHVLASAFLGVSSATTGPLCTGSLPTLVAAFDHVDERPCPRPSTRRRL